MRQTPQPPGRVLGAFSFPTFALYIISVGIIHLSSAVVPGGHANTGDLSETESQYYQQYGFGKLAPDALKAWIDSIDVSKAIDAAPVHFDEPVRGSLYPPDMASPGFLWSSSRAGIKIWLLLFATRNATFHVMVDRTWWVPPKPQWDNFKTQAGFEPVHLKVYGIGGWSQREVVAKGQTAFSISSDPVASKIAFIRKPLPFHKAKQNPQLSELLLADLDSYDPPAVLLKNQGTCFNCHAFSAERNVFGLDMDIGGDKGGYIFKPFRPGNNWVVNADVISWNDLPAPPPAKTNMGLFARPSPDGRFVAATVGESSVFVMLDDLYFSQLFFPATGRIACYDRRRRLIFSLPGADLEDYIQTGPAWSPDGKTLYFARARTRRDFIEAIESGQIKNESDQQGIDALNKKYPIQFDIYRLPFNRGKGGIARPLMGASDNGWSNYFPRVSPDGRWIVFTQSPTGMVLQPGSRLCIVPSNGGAARVLNCRTSVMNSWHSWSASGKWLAYSSKVQSPFTEIFLTHIDDAGHASPAIRLFRLSSSDAAAMVPEFVGPEKALIQSLQMKCAGQVQSTTVSGNVGK
jgi:hypothetical protein